MFQGVLAFCDRLLRDEDGQDQVEYALLTVLVGLLGAASADLMRNAIANAYGAWNQWTNDLWESPPPS